MELKTLWLGLVMSLAAFAVKTGLGWAYLWSAAPPGRKAAASAAVAGLYVLAFTGIYLLAARVDLLANYEIFEPLWRHGFTLHWLAAALLSVWGFLLLRQKPAEDCCPRPRTRGWLALVIPCPVCLSVTLMALAGLILYFPDDAPLAAAALGGAFLLLALAAGLVMLKGRARAAAGSAENALGLAMMLMAAYFAVSALVLPQFAEVSKVYRLSGYAAADQGGDLAGQLKILAAVLALAGGAFGLTRRKLAQARFTPPRGPR